MHPILFSIGKLDIRVYGALTALAFLTGIYLASIVAKKRGEYLIKIQAYLC